MSFIIHPTCKIHPSVKINVVNGYIGPNAIINNDVVIEGYLVEIGREAFIDKYSTIGGGSCFDSEAFLKTGDWFHMGVNSQVNIARGVSIGHEVGIGIDSKIFTHGAYLDCLNIGAPAQWGSVSIGNNVWIPNAWINPSVEIGSNVVIGARSLVNSNIPSGSLAVGSPVKIIKSNYYPRELNSIEKDNLWSLIETQLLNRLKDNNYSSEIIIDKDKYLIILNIEKKITIFDLKLKKITGYYSTQANLIKDQLRRNGIRFRYEEVNSKWHPWDL